MLHLGCPLRGPNAQDLEAIRQEILYLCSRQVGQEAARVLFYEVAGWFLEPQFALDAAVLRATWRLVVRPPAWRETLPVAEATLSPQLVLPQLAGVLDRLKWSLSHNARHLCCTDPSGEARRVCIGLESFRHCAAMAHGGLPHALCFESRPCVAS